MALCSRPASHPPSPPATDPAFSKRCAVLVTDLRKSLRAPFGRSFSYGACLLWGLRRRELQQLGVDHRAGRAVGRRAAEWLERDTEGRAVDDRRIVSRKRRLHGEVI